MLPNIGFMPRTHGFTRIEVVVVILILGLLGAVAAPRLFNTSKHAEINAMINERSAILTTIDSGVANIGGFPGDQLAEIDAQHDDTDVNAGAIRTVNAYGGTCSCSS